MVLPLFATLATIAVLLSLIGTVWARLDRPRIGEAVRTSDIADLREGRFRVVGRIVSDHVVESPVDGAACVFYEHADYVPAGVGSKLLIKESQRWSEGVPFYLDDGTGRVRVDPALLHIEAAMLVEDAGLTAERRLRLGEEVELVGSFAMREVDTPYRQNAREWCSVDDVSGAPTLTYRTLAGMEQPANEVAVFLRAAGVFVFGVGLLLAALVGLAG